MKNFYTFGGLNIDADLQKSALFEIKPRLVYRYINLKAIHRVGLSLFWKLS